MTLWIFGEILMYSSPNPEVALEWTKFSNMGAAFTGPALIWFVTILSNNQQKFKKWKLITLVGLSTFFSYFSLRSNLVFSDITRSYWGYKTINGILYLPFSIYVAGCATTTVIMAIINLPLLNPLQKKQMKLFSLAFALPVIGGIISEIIAPLINLNIPPLSSILFSYTGIIIAYAIIKYQFLYITPSLALQTVFDTMKDIVIAIDTTGLIKLINKAVVSILGYNTVDLINQPITTLLGPELSIENIKQSLKDSPDGFTTTIISKDNVRKVPVLVRGSIILSPDNTEQGLVIITHDVTHTNELTSNLKEKSEELEKSKIELEKNILEAKKLSSFMIDRELKMADLKKQIKKCKKSE